MIYEDITYGHRPELVELSDRLRTIILSADEAIAEDFFGGQKVKMASYSIGPKNNVIAVLNVAADHCKIFFHHVGEIDPCGLPFEGKGRHAQHIKLYHLEELDEEVYRQVIEQVTAIVRSKVPQANG